LPTPPYLLEETRTCPMVLGSREENRQEEVKRVIQTNTKKMNVPFSKPAFNEQEVEAASKAIRSGWVTTGPLTAKFEEEFAKFVGSKYAVFVNSGTSALRLAIEWNKTKYNLKTAYVPSLTFAATAHEAIHAGLDVLWGDVDQETMCLLPSDVGNIAIPVHLTGNRASVAYSCPVVEDSAHLVEKDQCKGSKNLVCFSFYATKNLSTGEGGMIACNTKEAYTWLMKARHHGIDRRPGGSPIYDVEFIGWKANQSDILAAIGLVQLKKLPSMLKKRAKIVDMYNKGLGQHCCGLHLYPVFSNDRDEFVKEMAKAGIQCSIHFRPLHKMMAYSSTRDLVTTEYLGGGLVSLPLFPDMTIEQVKYVIETIKKINLTLPL
jgi:dTDP-4-amino-4,6-dideoxygalactose transaminase